MATNFTKEDSISDVDAEASINQKAKDSKDITDSTTNDNVVTNRDRSASASYEQVYRYLCSCIGCEGDLDRQPPTPSDEYNKVFDNIYIGFA